MNEIPRVLIATVSMTTGSGTVTYTRDLALALLRQGWLPIVYSTRIGAQGEILRAAGIPVVTDLGSIGSPPDVIHGHHALETLAALTRFPDVPALFVCHDALTWHSVPPKSPRIRTIVAVDHNCRDRLVLERGYPPESVQVLTNAIDLTRFRARPPLPSRPKRALVFSNMAFENSFVAPIREACKARGIEVDVIGYASGNQLEHPEEVLHRYDIVFGKARCALEAATVGTAVIACDARGMSGMLTMENVAALHALNLGRRTLHAPVTAENVLRELDRYDAADATKVAEQVRAWNDSDVVAAQMISLYDDLRREPVAWNRDELQALSASLQTIANQLYTQMESGAGHYSGLVKLLNSRSLGPVLRFAWRLKKKLK